MRSGELVMERADRLREVASGSPAFECCKVFVKMTNGTVTYPTKDKRPTCSYPLAKLMKEVLDDKVKKVVGKMRFSW